MWILLDKGFISMVQHRDDPALLLVRARVKADISNVFGDDVEVVADPAADYLYRAVVPRERVAGTLREAVLAIDYDSHVKEVAVERSAPAPGRYEAYLGTWSAMSRMQPTPPYRGRR